MSQQENKVPHFATPKKPRRLAQVLSGQGKVSVNKESSQPRVVSGKADTPRPQIRVPDNLKVHINDEQISLESRLALFKIKKYQESLRLENSSTLLRRKGMFSPKVSTPRSGRKYLNADNVPHLDYFLLAAQALRQKKDLHAAWEILKDLDKDTFPHVHDVHKSAKYWSLRAFIANDLSNVHEVRSSLSQGKSHQAQPQKILDHARKELLGESESDSCSYKSPEPMKKSTSVSTPIADSLRKAVFGARPDVNNDCSTTTPITDDIISRMKALSIKGQKPKPEKENVSEENTGSTVVIEAIRAKPKQIEKFGSNMILSPVRRSQRNLAKMGEKQGNLKSMLENTHYSYSPNPALGRTTPVRRLPKASRELFTKEESNAE